MWPTVEQDEVREVGGWVMPGLVRQGVVFVERTMEKPIKGRLAGCLYLW